MKKIHITITRTKKVIASLAIIAISLMTVFASLIAPRLAVADSISEQISALQKENANNRNQVALLENQALSYQDAINRLQSQITILQGQINQSVAQQADLEAKIEAGQIELNQQRAVLGENIRAMYVEGQITTLEILATSKNLSDFVDKQQYRNTIKSKIQESLKKINKLQNDLKEQKTQVEKLIEDQRQQQAQLDASESQQANLLNYNKAQQADYNNKTKDNQAKIAGLIAEQLRANNTGGGKLSHDPNNGFYPYANYAFSMSPGGCGSGEGPDRWGYCTRQCVSYAAWAVERDKGADKAPHYYGSAKFWVQNALDDRVPVYSTSNPGGYGGVHNGGPQAGDVAISIAGNWGHAMYVDAVSGGQIHVQQYNAELDGEYTTQWRDWSNYYFLRF